ncbi:phage tail protein [Prosthecochloris sp.]|uniref:phage tail protein n=1 Tax=Prosthecochloris sp. TaxID=290513 RepID=UPI0025F16BEC|nr:phage tail protein [Prosthecochloris sp.]
MFIMLGAVGYARLESPTTYEIEKKADYAEMQVTEGKPLLQYMGQGLDKLDLSFSFHVSFTDPQAAWTKLVDMINAHKAFTVTMGNGQVIGTFVLSGLKRTTAVTAKDGTLQAIYCKVKLNEWAEPDLLEGRRAEKKSEAKAVSEANQQKPNSKRVVVPIKTHTGDFYAVDKKSIVRQ